MGLKHYELIENLQRICRFAVYALKIAAIRRAGQFFGVWIAYFRRTMLYEKKSRWIVLVVAIVGAAFEDNGWSKDPPAEPVRHRIEQLAARLNCQDMPVQVYEVSTSSEHYRSLETALQSAVDPHVFKVILLHPGKHLGAVTIRTENTHLLGMDRNSTQVEASIMASWEIYPSAVVDVQASYCSISNLTVRNLAAQPGQRAAVRVGNSRKATELTGFRCFNASLYAAQDTIWMQDNVTDGMVENCYIEGTSDVACNSGVNNTFQRCHVKGDGTWAAFWCGPKAGCDTPSKTNILDCTIEKAAVAVLIARSDVYIHGCIGKPNVRRDGSHRPIPLFTTSSDNTIAYLLEGRNSGFGSRWKRDVGDLCAYKADYEMIPRTPPSQQGIDDDLALLVETVRDEAGCFGDTSEEDS